MNNNGCNRGLHDPIAIFANILCMESKSQEYLAIILRNIGFGLFTPLGSIIFQWLVIKKDLNESYPKLTALVFLIGCLFLYIGYIILKRIDRKDELANNT